MRKPVLGELLQRGMPTVARPPGTVPGCPRWGYAVRGIIIVHARNNTYVNLSHAWLQVAD